MSERAYEKIREVLKGNTALAYWSNDWIAVLTSEIENVVDEHYKEDRKRLEDVLIAAKATHKSILTEERSKPKCWQIPKALSHGQRYDIVTALRRQANHIETYSDDKATGALASLFGTIDNIVNRSKPLSVADGVKTESTPTSFAQSHLHTRMPDSAVTTAVELPYQMELTIPKQLSLTQANHIRELFKTYAMHYEHAYTSKASFLLYEFVNRVNRELEDQPESAVKTIPDDEFQLSIMWVRVGTVLTATHNLIEKTWKVRIIELINDDHRVLGHRVEVHGVETVAYARSLAEAKQIAHDWIKDKLKAKRDQQKAAEIVWSEEKDYADAIKGTCEARPEYKLSVVKYPNHYYIGWAIGPGVNMTPTGYGIDVETVKKAAEDWLKEHVKLT